MVLELATGVGGWSCERPASSTTPPGHTGHPAGHPAQRRRASVGGYETGAGVPADRDRARGLFKKVLSASNDPALLAAAIAALARLGAGGKPASPRGAAARRAT